MREIGADYRDPRLGRAISKSNENCVKRSGSVGFGDADVQTFAYSGPSDSRMHGKNCNEQNVMPEPPDEPLSFSFHSTFPLPASLGDSGSGLL